MNLTIDNLLARIANDLPAIDLLETYGYNWHADLWDKDPDGPRLYRAVARSLIDQGYPALGLKVARRGLEVKAYASNPELLYATALAHARGGNLTSADQTLRNLFEHDEKENSSLLSDSLRVDVIALRGRMYKERYRRENDSAKRRELARESAGWYQKAADLPGADAFPLVNAATMRFLQGETLESRSLAERILGKLLPRVAEPGRANDCWLHSTLGEACVLVQDHTAALKFYQRAAELAVKRGRVGDLVSMLGNLHLLAKAGATEDPDWLHRCLGSVVVFAGHRIDPPDWHMRGLPPRFPNDYALARQVQMAIRQKLGDLNVRFGFCSLACGSDILFAEAMVERNAELHVVLPFAREDFVRSSVDYGLPDDTAPRNWRFRFEAVLSRLPSEHLHFATTEPHLGTNLLFEYANQYMQGLAVIRARQCLVDPVALVVMDRTANGAIGGTCSFLASWANAGFKAEEIDLGVLRGTTLLHKPSDRELPPPHPPAEMPRYVRSMLFADVAGFSKMREEMSPRFFRQFTAAVAGELEATGKRVLLANTWGDGFFAVFDKAADCASFGLKLLERVGREVDWPRLGFPDSNPLRVGLHAGPVFELAQDPILGRRNFFGQHVNRTARIEPVTSPGSAFASEQFAALLTMEGTEFFRCDLIGVERLAKGYDSSAALFRISNL